MPSDVPSIRERLAAHRTLGSAPEFELNWVAEHGELLQVPKGEFYIRKGVKTDFLWIVLSGSLAIYVDRGLGPRRVMEWHGGDVSGAMPYSRIVTSPGDVIALDPSDLLIVNRAYFQDMVRECPTVTTAIVHVMLDRARAFTSSGLQDEKMVSLGRMAAGLAHELNNPASAARRSARMLESLIGQAEAATRLLAAAHLSPTELEAIAQAEGVCTTTVGALSPLERADREEMLGDWLDKHGADADLAGSLVDTGATTASLDALSQTLRQDTFNTAARWIATCCALHTIASEIDTATSRIYDLVSAVKRFSYMDQAQTPEALDLSQGLKDSLSLLHHKARERSVSLRLDVPADLPRVRAIGSDVNQVWTNLVDNAVDASPAGGEVSVTARRERGGVVVSVVDRGAGIAPEIRDRIFDPFFTTKGVGKGTGLGLEITRRLVLRNNGDIEVDSAPGHTEFRVLLPLAPAAATAGAPTPA